VIIPHTVCKRCSSNYRYALRDIGILLICKECLYEMKRDSKLLLKEVYWAWEKEYLWDEYLTRKAQMDRILSRED
jgi:hypothetical protein